MCTKYPRDKVCFCPASWHGQSKIFISFQVGITLKLNGRNVWAGLNFLTLLFSRLIKDHHCCPSTTNLIIRKKKKLYNLKLLAIAFNTAYVTCGKIIEKQKNKAQISMRHQHLIVDI